MIRSIRAYLLLGVLAMLGCSTLLTLWLTSWHSAHEVEEVFDASLVQSARFFHGLVVDHQEQNTVEELRHSLVVLAGQDMESHWQYSEAGELNPGHPYESKIAFQAWGSDQLRLSSPETFKAPQPEVAGFASVELQGMSWRIYTLYDPVHDLWIRTGQQMAVREELTEQITAKLISPMLLTLPVLLLLLSLVIQWGLRPLLKISRQLDSRDSNDLEALPDERLPLELHRVVGAINRLFCRLREALQREKRFTHDAAHELRTPLAALRVHLESSGLPAERSSFLLQSVARMERLVSQLLALARLEPSRDRLEKSATDFEQVSSEVIAELMPLADEGEVSLELECGGDVTLQAEATLVSVLLRNLLENAIRYSEAGSTVKVGLHGQPDQLLLQVIDHGKGILPEHRQAVLQRFYRLNKSDGPGAGLGLSIVALIAEIHGASVQLCDTDGGGLTVNVSWPR